MNVSYENGTERQQGVVQYVLDNLLHLNLDRWPQDLVIAFNDDPTPEVHNEFAVTEQIEGGIKLTFRTDFPHFHELWFDTIEFAKECVGHELGHALMYLLPSEVLEGQLLPLFGFTLEDITDDAHLAWLDRPKECIAETFKDCFLRKIDRAYPNRTNLHLPIKNYAAFRAIFRQEMPSQDGGSDGLFRVRESELQPDPPEEDGYSKVAFGNLFRPQTGARMRQEWTIPFDRYFVDGEDSWLLFSWNGYFFDADLNQIGGVFFEVYLHQPSSGSWGDSYVYFLNEMPSEVSVTPALPSGAESTPTPINDDWTPDFSYGIEFDVPDGAETFDYAWNLSVLTDPWLVSMTHEEVVAQFEEVVPTLEITCIDAFKTYGQEDAWFTATQTYPDDGSNGLWRYLLHTTDTGAEWQDTNTYVAYVGKPVGLLGEWTPEELAEQGPIFRVTPGATYSYEFTFPDFDLGPFVYVGWPGYAAWAFQKRFVGTNDPALRRHSRFSVGYPSTLSDREEGEWLVFAWGDSVDGVLPGQTNNIIDPLAGTTDPVTGRTREWKTEEETSDWWYFPADAPVLTVSESFVVPEGVDRVWLNASFVVQQPPPAGTRELDIPDIQAVLPTLMICEVEGIEGQDVPPTTVAPGGVRGGERRLRHPVMG